MGCAVFSTESTGRIAEERAANPLAGSEKFAGLNRVKAQQLVFATVSDWMRKEIHALSMKTFTPEQWADESD